MGRRMILYVVKGDSYISYAQDIKENPAGKRNVYINLTNRCNCSCDFCLRTTKQFGPEDTLWLAKEPTAEEVAAEFAKYDLLKIAEAVFCGFGEPTMRLETLLKTAAYLKGREPRLPIRVNTNGLAELEYGKEIAPLFKGLVDTVSISLNASTPEGYIGVTKNKFGLGSYEAMLLFAKRCKAYVPHVVLTVVDCIGTAEIEACQKLCDGIGITLRVRPFE